MKKAPQPKLDIDEANKLISEATASDIITARRAIEQGVRSAQEQWIEAPLIAQALALELFALTSNKEDNASIATYLHRLADAIASRTNYH